jgi:aliphatic sulfonates family ABC transporter substrate-binding protein
MLRSTSAAFVTCAALLIAKPATADIRVGWQTGVVNAVLTYAVEANKFREQGLKVEMKPFAAGPAMLPAFAAGEIDLGWMGEFPATTGFANGLPLRIVLVQSMLPTDVRLVANPQSKISDLKDLKGKKLGVTLGSTSHSHVLLALAAAGLTEQDVTMVNLAPAVMVPAYTAGQIDAAFTWEPGSGELEKLGGVRIATTKSLGSMTGLFGVASRSYLATHPEDLQKFLRGWSAALSDYAKNPEAVLAFEAKRLNQPVGDLSKLIERQGAIFPPVEQQLVPDYLGSAVNPADSKLLAHVAGIGRFLHGIRRISNLPPSFEPLISPEPLQVFIKNQTK